MSLNTTNMNAPSWHLPTLAALVSLVFFKALFFNFVWDDNILLVGQQAYESAGPRQLLLTPINGLEYLPLRDLTYIADYRLWGWNPFGFHLTNLLLYVLNVLAVYKLTVTLGRAIPKLANHPAMRNNAGMALATAAIFAVHPLHSEVVSFIHCRNVLLSGMFFFLSCDCFLKHIESGARLDFAYALAFFTLALLSKATVIVLPLVLLLFLIVKARKSWRDYGILIPFFALAGIFFLIFRYESEAHHLVNESSSFVFGNYGMSSRLSVALQIPWFYVYKHLVPLYLSTEYDIGFSRNLLSPSGLLALVSTSLLFMAACLFRKRVPKVFFAIFWFWLCLLPVSNFFLTNPVVADRYSYLSSFAFAYLVSVGISRAAARFGPNARWYLLTPLLMVYALLAFERNDVWRSQVTVMEDMTKPYSARVKGYNGLGHYYFDQGDYENAFAYLQRARDLSPAFSQLEIYRARLALLDNKPDEALEQLDRAIRSSQYAANAWNLRAQLYEKSGRLVDAAWSYRNSLDSFRTSLASRKVAMTGLARVQAELEPALAKERKEVSAHPNELNRKARLAVTLQKVGLRHQAITVYEELLRQAGPKWQVYANIGLLYRKEKQFDDALLNYRKALDLNPSSAMLHNEIGVIFNLTGKYNEALTQFRDAVDLEPKSANPRVNLAQLYFKLGRKKEAKDAFRQIIIQFPEQESLAKEYLAHLED